ncbi:MAG: hypothetical protein RIC06_03760 [Cyclobacteriaceae bacterium]
MRILLILALVTFFNFGFSQHKSSKVMYGVGYGYIQDGWGDIPGQTCYFNGLISTSKSWLTFNGRVLGTLIERRTEYSPYTTFERSNGINTEFDVNFHLNLWKLNIYPSIGPTLRFSNEQHINYSSVGYDRFGQVVTFEVDYDKSRSVHLGYALGANIDLNIFKSLILGSRIAGMSYLNGNEYWYVALTLKNRNWRL